MDYGRLVSRSFEVVRRYRTLWLFGFLLALTGGSGGGDIANSISWNFDGGSSRGGNLPSLPPGIWQMIAVIIAIVVCIAILWLVFSIVLRFVSRGALVGLVAELEASQTAPTVRRGFRIGADRFWPLLGIALLINIPLFLVSIILIVIAAVPILTTLLPLLSTAGGRPPDQLVGLVIGGALGSVLLFCCAILFLVLVQLVLRPFYEFFIRSCVIARRGTLDAIREGYHLARGNLGNTLILYILIIAIGIGFGLLMIPVALILIGIPVGVGLAIGAAANSALPGVVVGLIIGIPMLLLLLFISGLFQAFESTLWTEGYLAMTAPPAVPALVETPPSV